jgi:hypothetical protein
MKTFLQLSNTHSEPLPAQFARDDIRYAPALVQVFMEQYTQPGERIFDPFAGYGTTLVTAEALGREAYGLELDEAKAAYIRSRMRSPERLLQADARRLDSYGLPRFHFSMTSPPFMNKDDATDPLSDYRRVGGSYRGYLRQLRQIYAQLAGLMEPARTVIIEASNLKRAGRLTTLAWDIAGEVAQVLNFEGEVVVGWDHYGYGYDHSYCLVFSAI